MVIQIDPEFKALIPSLSSEEYSQLEENLKKETNPDSIILTTWDGTLIDGHHRYEICQKHNISFRTAEKEFADRDDVKIWIIQNQFGRRNINNYQRSRLALELEGILQKKAKERLSQSGGDKKSEQYKEKSAVQISAPPIEVDTVKLIETTRQELAKIARVSHDTIAKVKVIEQKAAPEVKKELETGIKSINEVYKEIKKEEKEDARKKEIAQLRLEIEQTPEPLDGKYDVIVVDPPWQYGTEYDPNGRRIASPYPEMSLEDISMINLPASDDSILWLWTTHKFMRYSFELLDKWGFQDKVILTWVKDRIGIGSWLRSQTEFCIMAVKGSPKVILTNQSTVLTAPNREHSRKPDEFYKMVDSLCIGRKLDYFSREKREGWTQYGNEPKRF